MHTQIHYQGIESTPWMDDFISSRIIKLEKFLGSAANIQVHVKLNNKQLYMTTLSIHNQKHDYAYNGESDNLYESFTIAVDKGLRVLSEEKKKMKDRIHRKFFSTDQGDLSMT